MLPTVRKADEQRQVRRYRDNRTLGDRLAGADRRLTAPLLEQ
jgi:hypothetical protein